MISPGAQLRPAWWPFVLRWACYMLFWIVLAGTGLKDVVAGVFAAALASWASLRLLAPGELSLHPAKAARLFLRFLWQSVLAGTTVARMALMPSLPLHPGIIRYHALLPEGTRRQAFKTFASLLPGTLPLGGGDAQGFDVHCLDTRLPAEADLAIEEEEICKAFSRELAP